MASRSRKAKARERARRARHVAMIADRVGPTPETKAKLRPDSLRSLLAARGLGDEYLDAAEEIVAVYSAIGHWRVGGDFLFMLSVKDTFGKGSPLPDVVAWLHANRYLPWARSMSAETLWTVLDVVHSCRRIEEVAAERKLSREMVEEMVIEALAAYRAIAHKVRMPGRTLDLQKASGY